LPKDPNYLDPAEDKKPEWQKKIYRVAPKSNPLLLSIIKSY